MNQIAHSLQLDLKLIHYLWLSYDVFEFILKKYLSKIIARKYRNIFGSDFYIQNKNDVCFLHELIIENLYLRKYITWSWLCIDIWSNIGQFYFLLNKIVKCKWKIYSFEPLPQVFNILKMNNKDSYNFAISPEKEIILNYNDSTLVASAYSNNYKESNHITVQWELLQNIINLNNTQIELLKIDTEWAEFSILSSIPLKVLSSTKYILIECSGKNRPNSWSTDQIINYLYTNGFLITYSGSILYDSEWAPEIWDLLFSNSKIWK